MNMMFDPEIPKLPRFFKDMGAFYIRTINEQWPHEKDNYSPLNKKELIEGVNSMITELQKFEQTVKEQI